MRLIPNHPTTSKNKTKIINLNKAGLKTGVFLIKNQTIIKEDNKKKSIQRHLKLKVINKKWIRVILNIKSPQSNK